MFTETLRELVDWSGGRDAEVLTLLVDLTQEHAEEWARRELLALARAEAGLAGLVDDVGARLGPELVTARDGSYEGLALFRCLDPELDEMIALRFPLENQILLGRDPFLRQLLFYAEEYEPAVCAVVHTEFAELCEVTMGDLGRRSRVVPTHGRSLGQELNARLGRVLRDAPRHIVLLGAEVDLGACEETLSEVVRQRTIGRIPLPLEIADSAFLPAVHAALQSYERREEARAVRDLFERSEGAAIGVEPTLQAINQGRLEKLLVLHEYRARGWLCDACDLLGARVAPPACLACGATTASVALEEHIADQAAAQGAEIENVHRSDELSLAGGIGGLVKR